MADWPGWAQNFVRAIVGNANGPISPSNPLDISGTIIVTPVTGQKTMANSAPVVIASDQSAVPVTQALPAAPSAALAPSLYTNWGVDATHNVKASAGNVVGVMSTNINAAVRYLQLHNTATVPAGGATPLRSWVIPSGTAQQPAILAISREYFANSGYFPTGIAFAFSTTQATYTAATAADHSIEVEYI